MNWCKFCGQEIEWISVPGGKSVPVDPYPVFVLEGAGREKFLDDMGATITGRQAYEWEECPELYAAFVPHRRTCTHGR